MTRANRKIFFALATALAIGTEACSDNPAAPNDGIPDLPVGVFVSNASTLAYVAAVPGTFPGAASGAIRNLTRGGATRPIQLADGGFDPVGIEAATGDELTLTVLSASGGTPPLALEVPARRLLGILRTDPVSGRTGVALNPEVTAVFTEPVDRSTVTSSSVRLRVADGKAVTGSVQVAADGLTVRFTPDSPLEPGTTYEFVLNPGIHDLDGDLLAGFAASFTTLPLGTMVVTSTTTGLNGSDLNPDGYRVMISGVAGQQPISINSVTTFVNLAPGMHVVTLTGVSANCIVPGTVTRDVLVIAGATTAVSFDVACEPMLQLAGQLAFVSERDGNSEIYSVNLDGTGLVRLTNNAASDRDPAWSPDGRRIAFASNRASEDFGSDIFAMDADGSNVVRLTVGGMVSGPTWSPDGRRIAFSGLHGGVWGIFVMSLDDLAGARNVGHESGNQTDPAWSPDGTRIVFTSDWRAYDFVYDLYVAKPDGSGVTTLLEGPHLAAGGASYYSEPAWSPDGRGIAMVAYTNASGSSQVRNTISLANSDGSGLKTLVEGWGLSGPAWSPDGTAIAFSSPTCPECTASLLNPGHGGPANLHIMKVDGSARRLVLSNGHSPSWRR